MIIPSSPLGANHPVRNKINTLIGDIGRAALHAQYPNEFEYYACSFELTDSQNRTVDFFVFPVMPSSISQTESKIVNIRKTAGGITTLNTTTFEPIDIQLSGNFGRKLRILVAGKQIDFSAIQYSVQGGDFKGASRQGGTQLKEALFNGSVKTGYGCTKILQAIYRKANALDSRGYAYKLYFYNPAIGDNFLVKPINLQLSQNKQENMIWNYNINLRAIAPAANADRSDETSIGQTLGASVLNRAANQLANDIKDKVLKRISPQLI